MIELKFKDFMNPDNNGNMKFSDTPLDKLPLTMSYTPMQKFREIYSENEALRRGTLFPELDKPFYGKFTGVNK